MAPGEILVWQLLHEAINSLRLTRQVFAYLLLRFTGLIADGARAKP